MDSKTETIWPLIILKTNQIKYNLLELLTTIVEKSVGSGVESGGQQMDRSYDNDVLINRYFFEAIKDFVPQIRKTIDILSQNVDKIMAENHRLTEELDQYKRRQTNYERQLKEVRNLYHNLKDEIQMKEICHLMETDELAEEVVDRSVQKQEFNQLYGYLKTSLDLICSSSYNQKTVQSFIDNTESFKQFMASIRAVITDYINYLLTEESDELKTNFDPKLIEMICSFCANVFPSNEYSAQDIDLWIDSLTTLQDMDRQFRKCSTIALINICFAPNGTKELQKKNGMIRLLSKCLVDTEFKHEFKLKTNAVKVIRLMIDNSNDRDSRQKLFNEFIELISIERFQQMICTEQYIQLKKGMAALLNTLIQFNTTDIITED